MALWFMRLRTFLRIVLALLSLVGPLLGFAAASVVLRDWIQVPQGEMYYVEHNYLRRCSLVGADEPWHITRGRASALRT